MTRAYYANGQYRPNGDNPARTQITSAEWLDVVENEKPACTPSQVRQKVTTCTDGKHCITHSVRDRTQDECEDEAWDTDFTITKGKALAAVYADPTNQELFQAYCIRYLL